MSGSRLLGSSWREAGRLVRGSGFIFACRVSGAGLTLLAQVLLARWMGADQLGVYVLAFSWCMLLASISTLGFIPGAVRFIGDGLARGDAAYARAFVGFGVRVVLCSSVLIAFTGISWQWLRASTMAPADAVMVSALAMVPGFALLHFLGGVGNGYSRFALGFLPTSVYRPLLFCLLIAATFWWQRSLDARMAMYLAAAAVTLVLIPTAGYVWVSLFRGRTDSAVTEPRRWTVTTASLLIPALFTGYFPEVVIILAGQQLPSDQLAVLHVSFRIASLISFGLAAVDAYCGPEIARYYAAGDLRQLEAVVNRATRLRFWASLAALLAFAIVGPYLLALFGKEFVAGYHLLLLLSLGLLVQASVGPVVRLIGISNHQHQGLVVFSIALAVVVLLIAVLTPRFGATGAAVAAALVMAMWAVWMRWLTVRLLGIRPRVI